MASKRGLLTAARVGAALPGLKGNRRRFTEMLGAALPEAKSSWWYCSEIQPSINPLGRQTPSDIPCVDH